MKKKHIMKKILLFAFLLFNLVSFSQTTHDIDWSLGASGNLSINVGDSVRWTWKDNFAHSVTSLAGGSETFDSGLVTQNGHTFTFQFNNVGSTNYNCSVHALNMTGTISVTSLSVNENTKTNVKIYPNPVVNKLNITSPNKITKVSIYNLVGKKIKSINSNAVNLEISTKELPKGVYLFKVESDVSKNIFKIIKK